VGQKNTAASGVSLEKLSKRYNGFELGPISTALQQGVSALLGANGAGKTTLMRLIVGTTRRTSGEVTFGDGAARWDVGYLPQDFRASGRGTVSEYLHFVAWCRQASSSGEREAEVARALEDVGLADQARTPTRRLSGGMVRRLGLAQALLGQPHMLVLDEPTVGLDPVQRRDMRELIAELGETRVVLLSTHLAEDVAAVAQSVLVLDSGQMRFDGSVQELSGEEHSTGPGVEHGFLAAVNSRDGDGHA